jgi:hypothetical protein
MAIDTYLHLIEGDREMPSYYQAAKKLWDELFTQVDPLDTEALTRVLNTWQLRFEAACGGRWIGQEIMVVVGIGQFYDRYSGFEENLEKGISVTTALLRSQCSIEVHAETKKVATIFGLRDHMEFRNPYA